MGLMRKTANSFIEKSEIVEKAESLLTAEAFPRATVQRVLLLLGIAHSTLLLMIFSTILIIRLAYAI